MRQLEKEKQKKEHILVCLSSSPSNEKIIRTAAQMAQAFQAGFTALYVPVSYTHLCRNPVCTGQAVFV